MIATAEKIMQKLIVFNNISLDGYFVDANGEMRWAHNATPDAEWDAFAASNASGGGVLVFGRITYDLMASFWPTPTAAKNLPAVAEGMNRMSKVVFSRTMDKATWKNTRLVKSDPVTEMRKMKQEPGEGICILGSGSIVAQLAPEGLIDEYQFAVIPVVLGKGRTTFEGVTKKLSFKTTKTRAFSNGNVLLCYEPTA
jgi:dihydrofolate reductase